jgi:hypothetical protein
MKIKKMNGFVKFITRGRAAGITLAPFGIYIEKRYLNYGDIINHELIHWKQQIEMLIVFFYIWYLLEWLIKLIKYGSKSYYYLSFEREAYIHDNDMEYLNKRRHFAWFKYLKNESVSRM